MAQRKVFENSTEKVKLTDADYAAAALLLARSYKNIRSERENIRRWQTGERKYTEEDALRDLVSVTPKSDNELGVRIQTSGTSDQTARIGSLLAAGYAEKRQQEIIREIYSPEMQERIGFLDWELETVGSAMTERMTGLQANIFRQIYVNGKSYSDLIATNRGRRKINKWKINHEKNKALEAIGEELMHSVCCGNGEKYIGTLVAECRETGSISTWN